MAEQLRNRSRIVVRDIQFPGREITITQVPKRAITSLISSNSNFVSAVNRKENLVGINEPISLVLKNNEKSPKSAADLSIRVNESGVAFGVIDIYSPTAGSFLKIEELIRKCESTPYNPMSILTQDFYLSYDPAFAALPIEIREAKLEVYIKFLKRHLKQGGVLTVQLEDGNKENEEEVRAHNKLVLKALADQGFSVFDASSSEIFEYEREEDKSTGTLYVFINQEKSLGGQEPEERVEKPIAWEDEVAEIMRTFEEEPERVLVPVRRQPRREDEEIID